MPAMAAQAALAAAVTKCALENPEASKRAHVLVLWAKVQEYILELYCPLSDLAWLGRARDHTNPQYAVRSIKNHISAPGFEKVTVGGSLSQHNARLLEPYLQHSRLRGPPRGHTRIRG